GEADQQLGEARQRLLARAAAAFGANHSMATRLYAMLGDVLNEQDSVVSERLTLVATIFLPLTLATGFFGMNFQWMLDRLGTIQAFIVFGLVVPSLLTVATLIFIRRLTRSSGVSGRSRPASLTVDGDSPRCNGVLCRER